MCLMSYWAKIVLCKNASQLVEPGMFRIPEPATSFLLYFDLQYFEHCLIMPIDLGIYI